MSPWQSLPLLNESYYLCWWCFQISFPFIFCWCAKFQTQIFVFSSLLKDCFIGKPLLFYLYCIFVFYCSFMEILNRNFTQEIAKIIYHHFANGTLIAYQNITLRRWFFLSIWCYVYKYDFICLSEPYFDSMIPSDHAFLDLDS